jgi:hypothetical protein
MTGTSAELLRTLKDKLIFFTYSSLNLVFRSLALKAVDSPELTAFKVLFYIASGFNYFYFSYCLFNFYINIVEINCVTVDVE